MRKQMLVAALGAAILTPASALDAVKLSATFAQPVFLTAPAGDSRLFVVEKGGTIQLLQNGVKSTYLDISARVDTAGERGLLGLAFDPGFANNGVFYVNYIDKLTLNTVVSSFTAPSAAASVANASSETRVISVTQPGFNNHKAGWIGFRAGEPNNLYIATGDGGGGNDPGQTAQDLTSNLGKILRVDPTPGGGYAIPAGNPYAGATFGNDEIWSYGLRNPYRNSFDRLSGDFWIADVGQSTREEINFEASGTAGGRNYGWRAREGSVDNPGVDDADPGTTTNPIFEYGRSFGQTVIGGYVYHGTTEPGLDGRYFFGDFGTGHIYTIRQNGGTASGLTDHTTDLGTPFAANQLSSFGEDGLGNIYAVGYNGNIFRIAAVPEPESWLLLAAGLAVVGGIARRRRGSSRPAAANPGVGNGPPQSVAAVSCAARLPRPEPNRCP